MKNWFGHFTVLWPKQWQGIKRKETTLSKVMEIAEKMSKEQLNEKSVESDFMAPNDVDEEEE